MKHKHTKNGARDMSTGVIVAVAVVVLVLVAGGFLIGELLYHKTMVLKAAFNNFLLDASMIAYPRQ